MYKKNVVEDDYIGPKTPISNGKIISFIGSPNDTVNKNPHYEIPLEQSTTGNCIENENNGIPVENSGILNSSVTKQSLDEIIPESELSDNHKEMKNPSGKTFFIESTTYLDNDKKDNGEEDAKSAIAVLDDVLKSEESISMIHSMNDFNRKTSVDSAMIPSFIEASIIAMVHKSHESLREEENEENFIDENNILPSSDLKNIEDEQRDYIVLNYRSEEEIITLNKCEDDKDDIPELSRLFEEISDEVVGHEQFEKFDSNCNSEVSSSSNDENFKKDRTQENMHELNLVDDSNQFDNTYSDLEDETETMDPIHSESFKNKLSELISRPPEYSVRFNRQIQNENKYSHSSKERTNQAQKLKPIKSESDIQNMILENDSKDSNRISSENMCDSPVFDSDLDQTLFHDNTVNSSTDESDTVIPSSDLFKTKLEAMLKRGPSLRITKGHPIPVFPVPLSDIEKQRQPTSSLSSSNHDSSKEKNQNSNSEKNQNSNEINEHKKNFSNVLKSLQNKKFQTQGKLVDPLNQITIQDALKKLKPVAQITSSVH